MASAEHAITIKCVVDTLHIAILFYGRLFYHEANVSEYHANMLGSSALSLAT